jgi:hypothetical protein
MSSPGVLAAFTPAATLVQSLPLVEGYARPLELPMASDQTTGKPLPSVEPFTLQSSPGD